MPKTASPPAASTGKHERDLTQEARAQVKNILANTDWKEYWSKVTEQSAHEINAYEVACARSIASASRKFVH